jgi:hypothetical protein
MNTIPTAIALALESIGYDLPDIPGYRIEPGRIIIAIGDNDDGGDEGEAEQTIARLRRRLPAFASAEWTGASNTGGDGETTSDCEISWTAA